VRQLDNVILTPHMVAKPRTRSFPFRPRGGNITRILRGERPFYCKNPEVIRVAAPAGDSRHLSAFAWACRITDRA